MYGFIYVLYVDCYCSILVLDFQCIFGFGIVTRRVVYHRHNSFLVVARHFFLCIKIAAVFNVLNIFNVQYFFTVMNNKKKKKKNFCSNLFV
jgi:hypothetical protein